jgi:hypothetical protein
VTEYVQSISGDQVVLQQRTNNVMVPHSSLFSFLCSLFSFPPPLSLIFIITKKIYQVLEDFGYEASLEEFVEGEGSSSSTPLYENRNITLAPSTTPAPAANLSSILTLTPTSPPRQLEVQTPA